MRTKLAVLIMTSAIAASLAGCSARMFRDDLQEGMTTSEVFKKWGQPDKVEQTSSGSTSEETWKWSGSTWSMVVFKDGRVVRWKK